MHTHCRTLEQGLLRGAARETQPLVREPNQQRQAHYRFDAQSGGIGMSLCGPTVVTEWEVYIIV